MSRVVAPLIAIALLLGAWFVVGVVVDLNPLVFPSIGDVASSFGENAGSLARHTAITMSEAVLGFLLGASFACLLAVVFVLNRQVESAVYPLAVALKATPLVALAPLLIVWLGQGLFSKVVMAAMVAFFPVLVAAVDGLKGVEPDLARLFASYRASRLQTLWRLRAPSSAASTFAGLKIASTLAVVGAVIAEFAGSSTGIGHLIKLGAYNLDTPLIFASVGCIALAGVGFFALISFLHARVAATWPSR